MPEIFSQPLSASVALLLVIWLLILTWLFLRIKRRFTSLSLGGSPEDLRSILDRLRQDNQLTHKDIAAVKTVLKQTQLEAKAHFQNLGFLRYNPFSDTGGDQSFCLTLLDGQGSGVVISSLHSRDQTRIYAKKIAAGKSPDYTLSKEERLVIRQASKLS